MKVWEQRIVAAAFAVWLAAPLTLWLLGAGSDYADLEKRRPAALPPPSLGSLTDPGFYAEVARAFGDRVPLRVEAVALDAWLDLEVFGDSPNPAVLLGSDGWLFSADAIVGACRHRKRTRHAVSMLRKTSRILHASGRRLVVAIAPDKAAIYPERLGPAASASRCAARTRRRLRAQLAEAELPGYVDLWRALEGLKAGTAEDVYWPHDTHWTGRGAMEAARRIVGRLDPGLWDDGAVRCEPGKRHRGDLADMIGLPRWHETSRCWIERDASIKTGGQGGLRRVAATGEAALFEPPVLAIYDSFGQLYQGFVEQYLADSTWVNWRALRGEGLGGIVDELARAEVVILESVERSVINQFAIKSRDLPARLVGRLLDELPVAALDLWNPRAGVRESVLSLPQAAPGADRYLIVDVASSGHEHEDELRVVARSRADQPLEAALVVEIDSAGAVRRFVAGLPRPAVEARLRSTAGEVVSVGVVDLGE